MACICSIFCGPSERFQPVEYDQCSPNGTVAAPYSGKPDVASPEEAAAEEEEGTELSTWDGAVERLVRESRFFDAAGRLRRLPDGGPGGGGESDAPTRGLVEATAALVQGILCHEYGFEPLLVPSAARAAHPRARSAVFATRGWAAASRLVVVVQVSHARHCHVMTRH